MVIRQIFNELLREGNTIFVEGNNQFIRLKMHSNHAATIRMTTLENIDNFDAYNTYAQFS